MDCDAIPPLKQLLFLLLRSSQRALVAALVKRFDELYVKASKNDNIKINLPIMLPWLVISSFFDVLSLMNIPGLTGVMQSYWGDLVLFAVFVLFLLVFFPPLVRWLWNSRLFFYPQTLHCKACIQSATREHIYREENYGSDHTRRAYGILLWCSRCPECGW